MPHAKADPSRDRLRRASDLHRLTNAEVRRAALDQVDRYAVLVEALRATIRALRLPSSSGPGRPR